MSSSRLQKPEIDIVNLENFDMLMKQMIENDAKFSPSQSGIAPTVWKCRWYNNSRESGYGVGDAVWLNTESLVDFTASHFSQIKECVLDNPVLRNRYDTVKGDESDLMEFFKKVVTGDVCGNTYGQPLYFLGDITKPVSIRVSLSADNKHTPDDDAYWKNFFVDTSEERFENEIMDAVRQTIEDNFAAHMRDYHLSGIYQYWYDRDGESRQLSDYYLKGDMSNAEKCGDYSNAPGSTDTGFDYVVKYRQKKFAEGYWKWFRIWNSGLVEQGGTIDVTGSLHAGDEFKAADADGTAQLLKVSLVWSAGNDSAPAFTYSIDSNGFYVQDSTLDVGDGRKLSLPDRGRDVLAEKRYTVQVTPIVNNGTTAYVPYSVTNPLNNVTHGVYYMTKDVTAMTNSSFCIKTDPCVTGYSYYVSGIAMNAQQGYR